MAQIGDPGRSNLRPIVDYALANIHRYPIGFAEFNKVYGTSAFVECSGPTAGRPTGVIEHGLPESYISIWTGQPGGGKTRLAIAVAKAITTTGERVHFYEGESTPGQFRQWCGVDVHPALFNAEVTPTIDLGKIVDDCYRYKAKIVIIDSIQMVYQLRSTKKAELERAIELVQAVKTDKAAGCPHFIFISQVAKSGKLAGLKYLEHMADCVAYINRDERWRTGLFEFSVPIKNRCGPTPAKCRFMHTDRGIVGIGSKNNKPVQTSAPMVTPKYVLEYRKNGLWAGLKAYFDIREEIRERLNAKRTR